jgi:hypothetical protein
MVGCSFDVKRFDIEPLDIERLIQLVSGRGCFEIKRLHIERFDIEREDAIMTDRPIAASPWEVEAERRREVIAADAARAPRHEDPSSVRRFLASLRGTPDARPGQAGRLNQKRV